jgi:chromate reductase, NAD(P)H dehydrogenase (quinone)
MPAQRDIAVLVGSLRKQSYTRRAAEALVRLAPQHLRFRFIDIVVSLYNQDLETENPPADWKRLREDIRGADAVLFATPEYNRSMPGVLKNAIDVASRPYGKGAINGKPAAVMSVSTGILGGFGANHHLRQSAVFLDMPVLQQPEMYIGAAAGLWDDEGAFRSEDTRKLFEKFVAAFADWIELIVEGRERAPSGRA